jgi:hypothetical protein
LLAIKRILLVFWAGWLSVVVTTNVLDVLVAVGSMPSSFKFVSGNWGWINTVMDPLSVPRGMQATLFAGAITWEALAAILYWWAAATYRGRPLIQEKATLFACGVNLGLWAAFQVLDEVFRAYQPEQVHRAIFISQVATVLALGWLPGVNSMGGNATELAHQSPERVQIER